jgi:hypothetical protein
MSVERIEFSMCLQTAYDLPRPFPANKEIPEWYKTMPAEVDGEGGPTETVKGCPPFLEAMTCGYIIPLVADITLSRDQNGVFHGEGPTFHDRGDFCRPLVTSHKPVQVRGSPVEQFPMVKIFNPWLIRTSPGYSALFLAPQNRFQRFLYPVAGLVETDLFYREVNAPSVLTIPPGSSVKLPRGMPLMQVIPIKRDEFQSDFVPLDVAKYEEIMQELRLEKRNFYKDAYWRKKKYY